MINTVLGMSCVENQILNLMSESHMEKERVIAFSNSFLPLKEIYDDVIKFGEHFADFKLIDRIQDELIRNNLLELRFCRIDFESLLHLFPLINRTLLVRVNKDFAIKSFHTRGLRSDHYVKLYENGKSLYLQNDIPPLSIEITKELLTSVYENSAILLKLKQENSIDINNDIRRNRRFKPEYLSMVGIQDFDFPEMSNRSFLLKLRDVMQIYKISRYRLQVYESYFTDMEWMS